MKRIILSAMLALVLAGAQAQTRAVIKDVAVDSVSVTRPANIAVDMIFDLSQMQVGYNRTVALCPVLRNGADSISFPAVVLYGRNRWIQYKRHGNTLISSDEIALEASKAPDVYSYTSTLPYEKWMNGASVSVRRTEYGCASCHVPNSDEFTPELATYIEKPTEIKADFSELAFAVPAADNVKVRYLSGKAYVDFPVNVTQIRPEYRNNNVELGKIIATIDSVRLDPDVTVDAIAIKGFASPEGTYANNERLAKGRTNALADYVRKLYNFPAGVMHTSWEAENWQGLREYVQNSAISYKDEILAIIDDTSLAPDKREMRLRTAYPVQYQFLLANCYPALRVSDYKIEYVIRSYTDPAEIARILNERPQNLSLNEFYILAKTIEPGSPEFNEVFETAVRMYPNDEVANLNAANAALMRGDLAQAERYLSRAGSMPEAEQARAVLKRLQDLAAQQ